jgi:hypothetical protein
MNRVVVSRSGSEVNAATPGLRAVRVLGDLAGVAVWAAGLFKRTVTWRDQRLMLDEGGKIISNFTE